MLMTLKGNCNKIKGKNMCKQPINIPHFRNTVVAKCVFNLVVGAILPWSVILGNKNMKSYHKKRFSKFKNSTKDKIKSFKCKYNIVNPT
jgi:hypothetical protein